MTNDDVRKLIEATRFVKSLRGSAVAISPSGEAQLTHQAFYEQFPGVVPVRRVSADYPWVASTTIGDVKFFCILKEEEALSFCPTLYSSRERA